MLEICIFGLFVSLVSCLPGGYQLAALEPASNWTIYYKRGPSFPEYVELGMEPYQPGKEYINSSSILYGQAEIPMNPLLASLYFLISIPKEHKYVTEVPIPLRKSNALFPKAFATDHCHKHNETHNKILSCQMGYLGSSRFNVSYYLRDRKGEEKKGGFFWWKASKTEEEISPVCSDTNFMGTFQVSSSEIREKSLRCYFVPDPTRLWNDLKGKFWSYFGRESVETAESSDYKPDLEFERDQRSNFDDFQVAIQFSRYL